MNFDTENELFRDSIRRFVDKEMSPKAMREWARAATFPEHIYRKWGELGWLGMGLPEEMGGSAADPLQMVILAEELARNGFDITGPCFSDCRSRATVPTNRRPRSCRACSWASCTFPRPSPSRTPART